MPLVYQQNINLNSRLGLWHIREDQSFFIERGVLAKSINHPHKRMQTSAGRLLLAELYPGFPLNEVQIAPTRKPFLEGDSFHFSISHCDDYAAAIVSRSERVGVDIEVPQPKILALKDKFLSPHEQQIVHGSNDEKLIRFTMAWCMKEAVYKWYGLGKVDFRQHMPLDRFSDTPNGYVGEIHFKKEVQQVLMVNGLLVNGNCLAWVTSG